jgi:hypothetical protein
VARNLVRDSRFLRLVRFRLDDGFAGIEATFELSRFLLSRTERPSMSRDAELLAVAGVSEPLGAAALGVPFFPVVVAGRLMPDEDPDFDFRVLVCSPCLLGAAHDEIEDASDHLF